jgi:hypothetical protein
MDWEEWTIDKEIAHARACLRINAPHLLAPEQCVTCDGHGSVVHGDPYSGPGAEDNSGEETLRVCDSDLTDWQTVGVLMGMLVEAVGGWDAALLMLRRRRGDELPGEAVAQALMEVRGDE